MTESTPFVPGTPLSQGRTVIEASAGTGKTFAIAGLVAQLVAVEDVDIEEILVVTFTVAATAEVKYRVRTRLVETLAALEAGDEAKPHLAVLVPADGVERERRAARVGTALTRFDRAQIFTIHGFAQRLISQLGFLSQMPADLDPGTVDDALVAQVIGDLVAGRFAAAPADSAVPEHWVLRQIVRSVIDTPDARIVPDEAEVDGIARERVAIARAAGVETRRRMRHTGAVTFDEGLFEARRALTDPAVATAARHLLRERYRVALVDEAQDTDPVQWEVIREVFDSLRLVVIGDPKQSIYSFRGADVESYVAARRSAAANHTLTINWRSDGPLLTALDTLFAGATFGDDSIGYVAMGPAPDHVGSRIHGVRAPLTIRRLGRDLPLPSYTWKGSSYYRVPGLRDTVAADAAEEVVKLIGGSVTIDGDDGPRLASPADIAVLCRTRDQVERVRTALARRGVPSVAARSGSIFAAPVAEDWRRFLLALERPDIMSLVRLAATTVLVGRGLTDMATLTDIEALDLQQRVRHWQGLLAAGGIPPVVAELDRETGLAARVLAGPDGERRMTDLIHLAEELHATWRGGRAASLAGWLEAAMREAAQRVGEEPDERQRRLETDAAAVRVQTVHGAKGLEFPVVLVPFAWDVPSLSIRVPVFHDPDAETVDRPRPRLVDVAGDTWSGFAEHAALAAAEGEAEEGRLLYVALTRARHHLVLWWTDNHAKASEAKLFTLLTGRTPQSLSAESGGAIAVELVDAMPGTRRHLPGVEAVPHIERARLGRRLDAAWQRASFSSLSPEHPLLAPHETTEEPDRADETVEEGLEEVEQVPGSGLPMADLPRGARFGTLVHHVLEHAQLGAPDLDAEMRRALAPALDTAVWDFDINAFVGGMVAAATTPLGPDHGDIRLRDIDPATVLDELRFELPVRTGGVPLTLDDIGSVMLTHLPDGDPYKPYAADLAGSVPFRGFLTGAIDVTAALPGPDGPRYVVMDYKSNALPAAGREASPLDYGPGPLAAAMIGGNYVLQATLYQVALHRYLQWRLRGYDPARHLGGSMFLFIRGMAGPATPVVDGERCGVARWRPPAEMVVALSRLFSGEERP